MGHNKAKKDLWVFEKVLQPVQVCGKGGIIFVEKVILKS